LLSDVIGTGYCFKYNNMKKYIYFIALSLCSGGILSAQTSLPDTAKTIRLKEVIITSNKMPVLLKNNPGSVSLVTPEMLSLIPKAIGAEEALRLVPGVRIDNQHDGERVHMSIRGQGILTERGLRGIGVLIDGIPVNDPTGFVPDIYDVDWSTIKKIEVMRGPAAGMYGSGGAAGILNITTKDGGLHPIGGEASQTIGTNGFTRSFIQLDGSQNVMDYRVSYSRSDGDGYRDHQAFWSNKLYEKINYHPSEKLVITQIISHTDYFQQNPEGLNLGQFDNLQQANPDACPFNEYQKTNRTTAGFTGKYKISDMQDFEASSYLRSWQYKETSNKCAEYRTITNPGANAQYNLHLNTDKVKNTLSAGADFKWQNIGMYKLQSAADPDRVESTDETNLETDSLLANQIIYQRSAGIYALYNLRIDRFNLIGSIRYDDINSELTNKMVGADTALTTKSFSKTSVRIGASYDFNKMITVFANLSQGFMPPSTEELANNPVGYSGFNTHLIPATSVCFEFGARGFFGENIFYELTGFSMNTEDDFFRFKQTGRGNQEVFYGNAGNSKRNGIEAYISYKMFKNLNLQVAYTYADYTYTSASVDPVYTDTAYVLTTPPSEGQWLPNSPKHQLFAEAVYTINKNFKVSISTEYQSKWAIYTDAKAYNGELDPAIYQNWQDGFNLYHARLSYLWRIKGLAGEFSIFARNFTGVKYMAFTEPDPDGNSYQPGPAGEFFGTLKVNF
jgi:iron complex outermembrane recepter protein